MLVKHLACLYESVSATAVSPAVAVLCLLFYVFTRNAAVLWDSRLYLLPVWECFIPARLDRCHPWSNRYLIDPVGTVRRCQRYTLAVPHFSLSTPNFYHPFSEAQRFEFVLTSVNYLHIRRDLEFVRQSL